MDKVDEAYKNTSMIDMKNEIWKDVKGYEGLYSVSTLGRVKSHITKRILKQTSVGNNDMQVTLCCDGIKKHIYVSQIVAFTYIGFPNKKFNECICHLNKIKTDNSLANLSIETRSTSTLLSYHAGVCFDWGIKNMGVATQFVSKYFYIGTSIKNGDSVKYTHSELLEKYGAGARSIMRCIKKENNFNTAYGRKWTKELKFKTKKIT